MSLWACWQNPTPIGSFNLMAKACLSSITIGESLNIWRDCLNLMDNSVSAYTLSDKKGSLIAISCQKALAWMATTPLNPSSPAVIASIVGWPMISCLSRAWILPILNPRSARNTASCFTVPRSITGRSAMRCISAGMLSNSKICAVKRTCRSSDPAPGPHHESAPTEQFKLLEGAALDGAVVSGREGYPQMSEACAYLGLTQPTLGEGASVRRLFLQAIEGRHPARYGDILYQAVWPQHRGDWLQVRLFGGQHVYTLIQEVDRCNTAGLSKM